MKTLYSKLIVTFRYVSINNIALCLCSLSIASCDSFVEVDLPKSQLTNTAVFSDYTTANAAMADVYSKIRDTGMLTGNLYGLSMQMGNYADELDFYGAPSNATVAFYTNALLPANSTVSLLWNNSFSQIYAANAILENVKSSKFNPDQKAKLEGEALFLRALLHFYLHQIFGEIPYIKTTDYKTNSNVYRISSDALYMEITSDLKTAETLLSDTYDSSERVRVNSYAVKSLLARIYLYQSRWEDADRKATEVINNNVLYTFENDLNKVFLKNSTEAIWQFMPSLTGKNTDEASIFIFTSGPPPQVALSTSLIASFQNNDLRKTNWISVIHGTAENWYYASKYKQARPTAASVEYSIVLRLTEQYLIRAEAKNELGDLQGAKNDLNKIRHRAGLLDTDADSKNDLSEAILTERRKELFTEYGHRFFDLKRRGKLDLILGAKPGWNSTDNLLPIPETELISNPNLKPQNPGY